MPFIHLPDDLMSSVAQLVDFPTRNHLPQLCKQTKGLNRYHACPVPQYVEGKSKCPHCEKIINYRIEWCNGRWLLALSSCDNVVYQQHVDAEFWRTKTIVTFSETLHVQIEPWGGKNGFCAYVGPYEILSIDMTSLFRFC